MDIQSLVFFKAVAKAGSFSAAAHELQYAQSNISTKIQQLETGLQTTLFYRHNKGVTLTHKGEIFLQYTNDILALIHNAEQAMQDSGTATGSLTIGALETVTQMYLPNLLTAYHQNNPDVKLSIKTGNSAELTTAVLDRSLDAAFVSGHIAHPDLQAKTFQKETLRIAAAASVKANTWQEIPNPTLLVFPYGCYYRHLLETLIKSKGDFAGQMIEFDSIGAIISGVCAGLGISLLPASILAYYENNKMLTSFPVEDSYASVDTFFIYRKDFYTTTAFSHFLTAFPKIPMPFNE